MKYKVASYANHDDVNAKQQVMVSWTLPLSSWVKINSDGACQGGLRGGVVVWLEEMQESGYAVFLNFWANVVHMLHSCGALWRVWRWLEDMDSKVVVRSLIRDGDVGAARFRLVQKFRQLLELDWEVKVR